MLNRTLILPTCWCSNSFCPLNIHLLVGTFDKEFGAMYRESTFLAHPLVPLTTSQNSTQVLRISSEHNIMKQEMKIYTSQNTSHVTEVEIRQWFLPFSHIPVLKLGQLENITLSFDDDKHVRFSHKCANAFRDATNMNLQYHW